MINLSSATVTKTKKPNQIARTSPIRIATTMIISKPITTGWIHALDRVQAYISGVIFSAF